MGKITPPNVKAQYIATVERECGTGKGIDTQTNGTE